ncbi:MAG TPA: MoaD/ThiS family protein [Methylomusa anaerophila]|uniref:Sulfur carrier protein CysO n=1 Tax=Methylomusa anaerophila TaxID=1930071 RepID=A0A348AQS0_9FIRM|nr:MoaD/ThiS family protein [Methylomusa anaerophila]BBB93418.1 sulfur carrier protein CysO [Methylomusa anaerophila]HML90043.1 MoaD/ThiS family protein [Methylomusa anaerophila]
MAITVHFSTPLLKATENNNKLILEGKTVKEINERICHRFQSFKDIIYDSTGGIKKVINIYVNDDDIRSLAGEDTPLKDGDEVSFIPTIAGG